MAYRREDRRDANGGVHTDTANKDRKYRQSTYEDRQVANTGVEDLKTCKIRRAGNENQDCRCGATED